VRHTGDAHHGRRWQYRQEREIVVINVVVISVVVLQREAVTRRRYMTGHPGRRELPWAA